MSIHFTQYRRPDGRPREVSIDRSPDIPAAVDRLVQRFAATLEGAT
jgi:hypothetical protein